MKIPRKPKQPLKTEPTIKRPVEWGIYDRDSDSWWSFLGTKNRPRWDDLHRAKRFVSHEEAKDYAHAAGITSYWVDAKKIA